MSAEEKDEEDGAIFAVDLSRPTVEIKGGEIHCQICGAKLHADLEELHQHWHERKGDRGKV